MFSVTAKTQYGIRALVHLASIPGYAATSAAISASQCISPKYLEGILSRLVSAGVLVSGRGKGGGYRLAKDPALISMLEVVGALEGEIRPVECVDDSARCGLGSGCIPRHFWLGLKGTIDSYLGSRTLADIAIPGRTEFFPVVPVGESDSTSDRG